MELWDVADQNLFPQDSFLSWFLETVYSPMNLLYKCPHSEAPLIQPCSCSIAVNSFPSSVLCSGRSPCRITVQGVDTTLHSPSLTLRRKHFFSISLTSLTLLTPLKITGQLCGLIWCFFRVSVRLCIFAEVRGKRERHYMYMHTGHACVFTTVEYYSAWKVVKCWHTTAWRHLKTWHSVR